LPRNDARKLDTNRMTDLNSSIFRQLASLFVVLRVFRGYLLRQAAYFFLRHSLFDIHLFIPCSSQISWQNNQPRCPPWFKEMTSGLSHPTSAGCLDNQNVAGLHVEMRGTSQHFFTSVGTVERVLSTPGSLASGQTIRQVIPSSLREN